MDNRYFRAGIGSVIYTESGEVAFFKRSKPPVGIWQFQQGGIDPGEHPEVALWRELKEETGLEKADLVLTASLPFWISYTDLDSLTNHDKLRIGQVHQWYFLKLQCGTIIDLTKATDAEFDEHTFVTFADAIAATSPHKQHVYQTLYEYFIANILP